MTAAAGSREPACPLLLPVIFLCVGQPGLTALTEPPRSPYICLNCHSGTQPCQRESTARMRNKQNAPSQHSRGKSGLLHAFKANMIIQVISCFSTYITARSRVQVLATFSGKNTDCNNHLAGFFNPCLPLGLLLGNTEIFCVQLNLDFIFFLYLHVD